MRDALDFVDDLKAEVKAARTRAERLYSSTGIGRRWHEALSTHPDAFQQCMHGLIVDFHTQDKVKSMIWSTDEFFRWAGAAWLTAAQEDGSSECPPTRLT